MHRYKGLLPLSNPLCHQKEVTFILNIIDMANLIEFEAVSFLRVFSGRDIIMYHFIGLSRCPLCLFTTNHKDKTSENISTG